MDNMQARMIIRGGGNPTVLNWSTDIEAVEDRVRAARDDNPLASVRFEVDYEGHFTLELLTEERRQRTYEGIEAYEFAQDDLIGLGLSHEEAGDVAKVVWWASRFTDPGGDWNFYYAYNRAGEVVAERFKHGY